jgi:hypothetical protein
MATGSEISDIVLNIVQEPSVDEDAVLVKLNDCARWLSSRMILPSLDSSSIVKTVTTGNSVSLPVDFQRNLYSVDDGSAVNSISILNSRAQMIDYCDWNIATKTGTKVRYVSAVRPNILYTPIPTVATDITLGYQRKPTVIKSGTTIDLLPDGFDDIFTNYACWKIFESIEQGMEGAKTDTNYYMALCMGLRDELELSLTEGVSLPAPPIARMERW